jgi:tRNA (guanine10-N2)-dimethyltransferase
MKYFFILGNNPSLSAAEIKTVLSSESEASLLGGNILVLENPATDAKSLIRRLGGTIKIGTIAAKANRHRNGEIKEKILEILKKDLAEKNSGGKYCFGFSFYGKSGLPVFPIGLEIKKILKQKGFGCRLVTSREKILSSVVVEQNNLVGRGREIVLIEDGETIHLGQTEAVQDFKNLSFRDYGRPERDDASGMIPPKLAQIMLNLSGKIPFHCRCGSGADNLSCPTILDPFCGSGTILMEAALMGVKEIIGSDISEKAITDSKNNIAWIQKKFQIQNSKFQILESSATEISQKIKPNCVDAIVTEPYLGPQRGGFDPLKNKLELEKLYSSVLREFKKILKPDGRIVIIFPVRAEGQRPDFHFLSPTLEGWQTINPLPAELQEKLHTTRRGTIVYGRPGQRVWREIVILKPI